MGVFMNYRVTRLATLILLLGLRAVSLTAGESCGFATSLLKSGFEIGEQPPVTTIPADTTALTLTVDYPIEGATVGTSSLQIYGSLTGPSNTGIAVNQKYLTINNATKFTSRLIPLIVGSNTLTIVATTQDGATQTVVRHVTYDPNIVENVSFIANTAGDFAPLRIGFDLTTRLPVGQTLVARVQVDFDGDGNFDLDTTNAAAKIESNYADVGVYLVKARVTFDDGNAGTALVVRESTFRVQMQSLAYVRQSLCNVYYSMKHRLQAGQVTSATNTLVSTKRSYFQTLWNAQGANLATIAGRLGEVTLGLISDVSAEFTVAIPDPANAGSFLGFPVQFARDKDGVWRIAEM
jgi:hypothetical protein